MYTIYKMTCNENGKIYIGCTKNYEDRKKQHMRYLRGRYHSNRGILEDYEKGFTFSFSELAYADSEEKASELEMKYIADLNSMDENIGYNLNIGGLNSNRGYKQSDYAKQVASRVHSQFTGEKNSFYGRKHSEESKRKMSQALQGRRKGIKFTEEHRANLRKSNGRAKPISVNGVVYHSLTHAMEETGIDRKELSRIAKRGIDENIFYA